MHNKTIAVTPGRQDTTPPEFRGGIEHSRKAVARLASLQFFHEAGPCG